MQESFYLYIPSFLKKKVNFESMKKKSLYLMIIALIVSLSFFSCKKDKKVVSLLPGENWTMTSYSAFMPSLPSFNIYDIVWNFNHATGILTITNNVQTSYPYTMGSGTYNFVMNSTNDTIIVNGVYHSYHIGGTNNSHLGLVGTTPFGTPTIADLPRRGFSRIP